MRRLRQRGTWLFRSRITLTRQLTRGAVARDVGAGEDARQVGGGEGEHPHRDGIGPQAPGVGQPAHAEVGTAH